MKVVVHTPSRLHFGLLSLESVGDRQFGGAGLSIADPGIKLHFRPSDKLRITGQVSDSIINRSRGLVERIAPHLDLDSNRFQLEFESCPNEHEGLGTGTQLSLAIAAGLAQFQGGISSIGTLIELAGRGRRSAIGAYAFERGGFLVDGGQLRESSSAKGLAPLLMRLDFPVDWPIVLFRPDMPQGIAGNAEEEIFAQPLTGESGATDRRCRRILLEMLPALVERDFSRFAKALSAFNADVGDSFTLHQGGRFASTFSQDFLQKLQQNFEAGIGQSSWGPTLFAIFSDRFSARAAIEWAKQEFPNSKIDVVLTHAQNEGASVEQVG